MGFIGFITDAIVFLFSTVILIAVPLIDVQTVIPKCYAVHPPALVELKRWYAAEYGDYLMNESPPFFTGLVWAEILLLWPLSVANIWGIVARKRWVSTTSLASGISVATSMAAVMGELLGSGRASDKLLRMYAPFVAFAFFAVLEVFSLATAAVLLLHLMSPILGRRGPNLAGLHSLPTIQKVLYVILK